MCCSHTWTWYGCLGACQANCKCLWVLASGFSLEPPMPVYTSNCKFQGLGAVLSQDQPPSASADTIERVNQVISGFSGDTRAWAVCWLLVCAKRLNKCTCLPMHCLPGFVSSLLRSPLFPPKSITHERRATTPAKAFLPNAGLAISCQPLPAVLNSSKLTS